MAQVKRFDTAYRIGIAALASAVTILASNYFDHVLPHKSFLQAYVLASVAIIIFLLDMLVEELINRSQKLRRMIAGHDFIEGYWHDETVDRTSGRPIHGVLFQIMYEEGDFLLTGVTFDSLGKRIATFRSTKFVYNNRVLFYEYEAYTEYGNNPVELGMAQIQFDLPAVSYSGFYFAHDGRVNSKIVGQKVSTDDYIKYKKFENINDKRDFVCSILKLI